MTDILDTERRETTPVSFDFTDLRRTLRESAYTLTAFPHRASPRSSPCSCW